MKLLPISSCLECTKSLAHGEGISPENDLMCSLLHKVIFNPYEILEHCPLYGTEFLYDKEYIIRSGNGFVTSYDSPYIMHTGMEHAVLFSIVEACVVIDNMYADGLVGSIEIAD